MRVISGVEHPQTGIDSNGVYVCFRENPRKSRSGDRRHLKWRRHLVETGDPYPHVWWHGIHLYTYPDPSIPDPAPGAAPWAPAEALKHPAENRAGCRAAVASRLRGRRIRWTRSNCYMPVRSIHPGKLRGPKTLSRN